MPEAPLLDSFAEIEDPRHPRNTLYRIEEILLLAICGAISGADDFVSIVEFGEAKLSWLRRLLPFEHGVPSVPSHDTLTRVFGQIEPSEFERCFRAWTRRVEKKTDGQVVAVDGKTLRGSRNRASGSGKQEPGFRIGEAGTGLPDRGSRNRASGEGPLHLVEAWATEQGFMLGQKRSEEGTNEIATIPRLLEVLSLEGCIVTTDAMGCQTSVAEAIIGAEADYVLRLKNNQEGLRADVEQLFERRLDLGFEPGHSDVDGGHGRVETRRCWAIDVAGKGLVDEDRWPGLQSVALVKTERFAAEPQEEAGPAKGETETERRYLISSLKADAEKILEASRQHWQIENGLHWVLGVPLQGSQPGENSTRSGELGALKAAGRLYDQARRPGRCRDEKQTQAGRPATTTESICSRSFNMQSPWD